MSVAPLVGGTLYLVATPIGNLEDITYRAVRTLRECDVVAAEDTRRTGRLLQHLEIKKPLVSYYRFNEARRTGELVERLLRGEIVVLVSDAGTPGVSDPGQRLVVAALKSGARVETVPGACALIAALTASGLPTDEFHFIGFLPQKPGARKRKLEQMGEVSGTLVIYESPYRVQRLLNELAEMYPERKAVLARELTKKHEEWIRGRTGELAGIAEGRASIKGECVVVLGPRGDE